MSAAGIESVVHDALIERTSDYVWADETAAHLADAIRAHIAETLTRPEVVEAAVRAIDLASISSKPDAQARAALAAVREALGCPGTREDAPESAQGVGAASGTPEDALGPQIGAEPA